MYGYFYRHAPDAQWEHGAITGAKSTQDAKWILLESITDEEKYLEFVIYGDDVQRGKHVRG